MKNQSSSREFKERIESFLGIMFYFLGVMFMGFIYAIAIVALVAIVIQLTTKINIINSDTSYRLLLFTWIICVAVWHIHLKHKEEGYIQGQLKLLRQGKQVYGPHPKLMERWEDEKKVNEFEKHYEVESIKAQNPFGLFKEGREKFYRDNGYLKDSKKESEK